MKNAKKFLITYNKIDQYLRKMLKSSKGESHSVLIKKASRKNKLIRQYRKKLRDFSDLRNALIHYDTGKPIAEPFDHVVEEYKKLFEDLTNPIRVLDIAVKKEKIFCAEMESFVLKIMKEMMRTSFSHVPILNSKKQFNGVFSETTVFEYAIKNGVVADESTKVEEFKEYLPVDKHFCEYFEFIDRKMQVCFLREKYSKRFENGERLGAYFITQNGKSSEQILGLLTAWDLSA